MQGTVELLLICIAAQWATKVPGVEGVSSSETVVRLDEDLEGRTVDDHPLICDIHLVMVPVCGGREKSRGGQCTCIYINETQTERQTDR